MEETTGSHPLLRSREDRRVAGVAGGLAAHLGVDADWVRLGFALGSLLWGLGILLYALLWIALPEAGDGGEEGTGEVRPPVATASARSAVGIVLLALGLILLWWKVLTWISFQIAVPVALILVGIFLLRRGPR